MKKNFKCLICNAIVEVEFDGDKSIKRDIYDEYSITRENNANYLYGGKSHLCQLLQENTLEGFNNLIAKKEVIEIC